MMRSALVIVLCALAACDEAPDRTAPKPQRGAESGDALKVAQLEEGQRNIVFVKAIRAAGFAGCLEVKNSARATMMDGSPGWKADCDNGTSHLIQIRPDGTADVTSRSDTR